MSCPLFLEMPVIPVSRMIAVLCAAGIETKVTQCDEEFICRRGWTSFVIHYWESDDGNKLNVMFLANTEDLRWWNFPAWWLIGALLTPLEIKLQRDALEVLKSLGATVTGGGTMICG